MSRLSTLGRLRHARNPQGVALPLAVFALAIMGVLIATSFLLALEEQRLGRNTVRTEQAAAAAEAGAARTAGEWTTAAYGRLRVGDTAIVADRGLASGWYRGSVRRLSARLFLVRSEGFSADSSARRQVGLLLRLDPIEISAPAALTSWGAAVVRGAAALDGRDGVPDAWMDCPEAGPSRPGLRLGVTADLDSAVCGAGGCVLGMPPVSRDSGITDLDASVLGDQAFRKAALGATVIIPGGTVAVRPRATNGKCAVADPLNWGSPQPQSGPCGDYFPSILSQGSLTIADGEGQGVLMVDGDLTLGGGARFTGMVLVRGVLRISGPGGQIVGAVVAGGVELDTGGQGSRPGVRYSSCAVSRARVGSAPARRLPGRAWLLLY